MLKLAFYKGKGTWIDRIIRWWTQSIYSHVELVCLHKDGLSIGLVSSSPRDGGVRYKVIPKSYFKADNWTLVDASDRLDMDKLGQFFINHYPAHYDFKGILLSQLMSLNRHSKNKYFCSEFCAEALGFARPHQYSPQDLFTALNMKQETT